MYISAKSSTITSYDTMSETANTMRYICIRVYVNIWGVMGVVGVFGDCTAYLVYGLARGSYICHECLWKCENNWMTSPSSSENMNEI